jgi:hypothetical protein
VKQDVLGRLMQTHAGRWWRGHGVWWLFALALAYSGEFFYIHAPASQDFLNRRQFIPIGLSDQFLLLLAAYVWVLSGAQAVGAVEDREAVRLSGVLLRSQLRGCVQAGLPVLWTLACIKVALQGLWMLRYYHSSAFYATFELLRFLADAVQILPLAIWLVAAGVLSGSFVWIKRIAAGLLGLSIVGSVLQVTLPAGAAFRSAGFQMPRPFTFEYGVVAWAVSLALLCIGMMLTRQERNRDYIAMVMMLPVVATVAGLIASQFGLGSFDMAPLPFDAVRPLDAALFSWFRTPLESTFDLPFSDHSLLLEPWAGWRALGLWFAKSAMAAAAGGMFLCTANMIAAGGKQRELELRAPAKA